MKNKILLLFTIFMSVLLVSCTVRIDEDDFFDDMDELYNDGKVQNPENVKVDIPDDAQRLECRVVSEDDGVLLLADVNGTQSSVYKVNANTVTKTEFDEGDLIEIYFSGDILETYPAKLGDLYAINKINGGKNDLCDVYLDALEEVWEKDKGLNTGAVMVSVDLSKTRLSEAEKSAVALAFSQDENIQTVYTYTYEQLDASGFLKSDEGSQSAKYWPDGVLLTITENQDSGTDKVTFDAVKWKSGLGAYYLNDCTSTRRKDGTWTDFKIGSEAIS